MTRINACIAPLKLENSHLLGEYHEILRVIPLAIKRNNSNKGFDDIKDVFCLGSGHVIFFYDKLQYIHKRFDALRIELIRRGFNPTGTFDMSVIEDANALNLYNDWTASPTDNQLVIDRLLLRLPKNAKYLKTKLTLSQYSTILYED